jgi:hypothetical protein
MTGLRSRGVTHALAVVLGAANLALVARPDGVSAAVAPGEEAPPSWLVKLLAAGWRSSRRWCSPDRPTRRPVLAGASVDALYAASMVGAARLWPRHHRAATVSAAAAAVSAVLELTTAPPARLTEQEPP